MKRTITAALAATGLLTGGALTAAPAQASMDVNMKIGITNDSPHAVYVVVDWEGDSSGPSGPVSATAPPQGTGSNPWTFPKFADGTNAFIEVDYEGSGDIVDLVARIVRVSMESVAIIDGLPKLKIIE